MPFKMIQSPSSKLGLVLALGILSTLGFMGSDQPGFAQTQAASNCCWIDAATGKSVPTVPQGGSSVVGEAGSTTKPARAVPDVQTDPADPNHAHNSKTGQNFVKQSDGSWIDAKTGECVPAVPQGGSSVVGEGGSTTNPARAVPDVQTDPADPNHAHNSKTGQNFVRAPCPPPNQSAATGNPPPRPKPNPKKKLEIAGIAAAGGITAIAIAGHGGGGSTPPSAGGPGTGGPATWDPRTLNSPPPYKGDQILQGAALSATPHNICAGSDAKFGETVTVNLNAAGSGTITLDDTPGFQRVYQVTVTALNQSVTSQGTFAFFGAQIPGSLAVSFTSSTQMTLRETTTFGSCSNTYSGTMTR